jgi:hypothetical protein
MSLKSLKPEASALASQVANVLSGHNLERVLDALAMLASFSIVDGAKHAKRDSEATAAQRCDEFCFVVTELVRQAVQSEDIN